MPKVFYDQRWCVQNGIGRFATELKARLENTYAIAMRDVELKHSPTDPLDPFRLARFLKSNQASLFISPGFNVPVGSPCQTVATIHDLIHVQFAGEQSLAKSVYYRYLQRPVIRRSPMTLTVSEFSRQQILNWYRLPDSRVVSVGNGISDAFTPDGSKRVSTEPYFVYVGNTKPHKNLPALLDAFETVANSSDASLLMVVKSDHWLKSELEERRLVKRVKVVSGVDDETLASFYRGAVAAILPSHFEGFGLPLVEAMACGCPVLGANVTSIPEVMGEAGISFSPNDPAAISKIMLDLLSNQPLRQQLAEQGLTRAKDFSWDQVAQLAFDAISPILCQKRFTEKPQSKKSAPANRSAEKQFFKAG